MVETRNPCLDCDLKEADKNNSICEFCEERINYLANIEQWTDLGKEIFKNKIQNDNSYIKYCDEDGCDKLHYKDGKCKTHFHKIIGKKLRESKYAKGSIVTLDFRRFDNGPELNHLLRSIALQERRSVPGQILHFVELGLLVWLQQLEDRNENESSTL